MMLAVLLAFTVISACGGGTVPVKITNDLGSWDIRGIYISPSDNDSWGDNHLAGEILYPGDDVTINVPAGTYDIKVVDEDGDSYTLWGVEIGADGYQWAVTLADID